MAIIEKKETYFGFLLILRDSGKTNMFGARPYLRQVFPELTDTEAGEILGEWMDSFKKNTEDSQTQKALDEYEQELTRDLFG